MKKLTLTIASLVLMTLSFNAIAQNTVTSEAVTASAKIIAPLTIENTEALQFGNIAVIGSDETVRILPDGTNTPEYSDDNMKVPTTTVTSAKFTITGQNDFYFKVDLEEEIEIISGGNSMTIETEMNLDPTNNQFDGNTETLYVGGTLSVADDQVPGDYTGTFTVTVTYE